MKIQYISDLHLEMLDNYNYLIDFPLEKHGDILVIAGDLLPYMHMERHRPFFQRILKPFDRVFWLPGNHEYYHSQLKNDNGSRICEKIEKNILLIDNYSEIIGKTKLIFSTLWSELSNRFAADIQLCLNDFRMIKTTNGHDLDLQTYSVLHQSALSFIKKEIAKTKSEDIEKIIVVTHHAPTFLHYPKEYIGSFLNSAFATELSGFIAQSNIDYWIYGHHHRNISDFNINKTQILTNQLGYVRRNENKNFSWNRVIEI